VTATTPNAAPPDEGPAELYRRRLAGLRAEEARLERAVPDGVEILVLTFWRSLDAVRGFAGDDLGRAVVAEEAAALLTRFDREVRHYEVAVRDDANADGGESR